MFESRISRASPQCLCNSGPRRFKRGPVTTGVWMRVTHPLMRHEDGEKGAAMFHQEICISEFLMTVHLGHPRKTLPDARHRCCDRNKDNEINSQAESLEEVRHFQNPHRKMLPLPGMVFFVTCSFHGTIFQKII